MSNPKDVIVDAKGMSTHPNDLKLDNGALSVAENVIINRENVIERRRGFKELSTNLPDFAPTSMFTVGGESFVVVDNLLWKLVSGAWVAQPPVYANVAAASVYGNDGVLVFAFTSGTNFAVALNTSTGAQFKIKTNSTVRGAWYDSATGNLYTSHGNAALDTNIKVQNLLTGGESSVFAGSATAGTTGTSDGTSTAARFNNVSGLWGDGAGSLYAADTGNHTIRKITYPGAVVTTVAGTAGASGETDNTGSAARFTSPTYLTGYGSNLYVSSSDDAIRKVTLPGFVVTTFAGDAAFGYADGTGTAARFSQISGLSANSTDLYVADGNNETVRRVTLSGAFVTTPFGTVNVSASTDGVGTAARFQQPRGVVVNGSRVYVGDTTYTRLAYLPDGYVASVFAPSPSLDFVNSSMIYGVNR